MSVPLTRWDTLASRLRTDGLISDAPRRHQYTQRFLQVAAALLLVAGGVAAGRASAGAALVPGGLSGAEDVASMTPPTTFRSAEDAQAAKVFYFDAYQRAVDYLASQDNAARSAGNPATMRTRLSALDRTSQTIREALNEAPWDPVLNGLYINSFAEREATIRQLHALPPGARANSF